MLALILIPAFPLAVILFLYVFALAKADRADVPEIMRSLTDALQAWRRQRK
jgi:hypothetical protein